METTKLISPGQIDSVMKLRVILVYSRHRQLRAGVASLAQRLPGNHWALEEALEALAEAGLLDRTRHAGHAEYALATRPDLRAQLAQLAASFDDPHRRDEIYSQVRAAEQERGFRDAASGKWRALGDNLEMLVV